jgi:FtsP/CotA-like multicopper oxidase with cupredoxin domain
MREIDDARPARVGRRGFLRTAGLAHAGGAAAGQAVRTAAAAGPHHGGQGSMMFTPDHNMIGSVIEAPGAPSDEEVDYKEFRLEFTIVEHEILPGIRMPCFAFNGRVPGPVFRVQENDWIKVVAVNKTEEMHTIHWHGVDVIYTMDGVPMVTQDPIHPQSTFVYRFQARPHGTRFYHCHWSTPLHFMAALHGAFIIDTPDDPIRKAFPYERDYVLVLESFDVDFAREHLNEVLAGMKRVNRLMEMRRPTSATHAFFQNYRDFTKAIEDGWRPPYTRGNAPRTTVTPRFFAINGKSYPATVETEHLYIRRGENIRVRLINGGVSDHHMHLHGHQFWKVAEDGNPLPQPHRLNTVPVTPGKTVDIVIQGTNPGFWDFHDHMELHTRNNGVYPGGMITMLEYEDLRNPPYVPSITVNQ